MTQVTEEQIRQDLENLYEASNIVITDDETEPFDRRLIDFIVSQRLQGVAEAMAQMAGFSLDFVDGGVDTVATENIDLEGWQDLWGVDGGDDKLVAVVGQTAKAQNGLYRMKQGPWVRAEGYTTPQELSRIAFFVADGLRLGEMYVQSQNLTSLSDPKSFTLGLNLNKALINLASAFKESKNDKYVEITGTTTTEEIDGQQVDVFTPKNSYNVKTQVGSYSLEKVELKQGTVTEVGLKKDTEWTYDEETGELWISPAALVNSLQGHEIHLGLSTTGTLGVEQGFDFEYLPNVPGTNLGWRRLNQTKADARPIEGASLTVNAGLDTGTYAVVNASNGYTITHNKGTTEVTIEAVASNGKPDRNIYAIADGPQRLKLYIAPNVSFTGKIYARFYPKAL